MAKNYDNRRYQNDLRFLKRVKELEEASVSHEGVLDFDPTVIDAKVDALSILYQNIWVAGARRMPLQEAHERAHTELADSGQSHSHTAVQIGKVYESTVPLARRRVAEYKANLRSQQPVQQNPKVDLDKLLGRDKGNVFDRHEERLRKKQVQEEIKEILSPGYQLKML